MSKLRIGQPDFEGGIGSSQRREFKKLAAMLKEADETSKDQGRGEKGHVVVEKGPGFWGLIGYDAFTYMGRFKPNGDARISISSTRYPASLNAVTGVWSKSFVLEGGVLTVTEETPRWGGFNRPHYIKKVWTGPLPGV